MKNIDGGFPGSPKPREDALKIYKEKYLPSRRASRKDPAHNQDRLEIKSAIANAINSGDSSLVEHFEKLSNRINKGQKESSTEFAARISDGESKSSKREPSLVEAVLTTQEFNEIYNEILESFKGGVVEVMRIGSSFWGQNYSIRSKERQDPSDIDLEIVVDMDSADFSDPKVKEAFLKFKENFQKGEADYCVVKLRIKGIEVSFHLVPTETLKKICEFDYANAGGPENLREFRINKELTPKTYKQRNFAGDMFSFTTTPRQVEGGQISDIPFVAMGPNGELILGVVLNKYLPIPKLTNDSELVANELKRMVDSLKERKDKDKNRLQGRELSFKLFHSHVDRMPKWMQDQLNTLD